MKKNGKKIVCALLALAIIVAVVDAGIVIKNIRARNESDAEIEALRMTMQNDITDYASEYILPDNSVLSAVLDEDECYEISESAVKYLAQANANVDGFSNTVTNTITKSTQPVSGINEEQLKILTTSIETLCITDTYDAISKRKLVDTASLQVLAQGIDSRIRVLEQSMQAHSDGLDAQLSDMQTRVNEMSYADSQELVKFSNQLTSILKQLQDVQNQVNESGTSEETQEQIRSQLNDLISSMENSDNEVAKSLLPSLKALNVDGNCNTDDLQDVLQTAISSIVSKLVTQGNEVSSLSDDLTDLASDYSSNSVRTAQDINNTRVLINTVNRTLSDTITANDEATRNSLNETNDLIASNKTATDNAIAQQKSNTETSVGEINTRIDNLNTAITEDIDTKIDALTDNINNNITTAINDLNTTVDGVAQELTDQQDTLQGLIDTANADYSSYVNAVTDARDNALGLIASDKTDALSAIANDLGSKTTSGALFDIETDRLAAISDISNKHSDALSDIATDKAGALSDIASDRSGALSDIDTAKNSSVSAVSAQESSSRAAIQNMQDEYSESISAQKEAADTVTENLNNSLDDINSRIDGISDDLVTEGYVKGSWNQSTKEVTLTFGTN